MCVYADERRVGLEVPRKSDKIFTGPRPDVFRSRSDSIYPPVDAARRLYQSAEKSDVKQLFKSTRKNDAR